MADVNLYAGPKARTAAWVGTTTIPTEPTDDPFVIWLRTLCGLAAPAWVRQVQARIVEGPLGYGGVAPRGSARPAWAVEFIYVAPRLLIARPAPSAVEWAVYDHGRGCCGLRPQPRHRGALSLHLDVRVLACPGPEAHLLKRGSVIVHAEPQKVEAPRGRFIGLVAAPPPEPPKVEAQADLLEELDAAAQITDVSVVAKTRPVVRHVDQRRFAGL